ncbi:type III secretion system chaperone [Marivita sp. GX14005]|uniref:type III secretion system chaperone n=1 Tax=Marivita sp. GX14005 TaxID=2942276 RepID=UPI00201995A6|nr:type III secretion system chaperone [Marivita sp. GX14005]MCL3883316.1 type III secretion system chaperone [Marivita sp. GX14005]
MKDNDRLLARIGEIAGQRRFAANAEGHAELIVDGASVYFFTGRDDALEASVELPANVAREPDRALTLLRMNRGLTDGTRIAAEPGSGRVFLCAELRDGDDASLTSQIEGLLGRAQTLEVA